MVQGHPQELPTEAPFAPLPDTWEGRCNNMIFNSDMELGLEGYWQAAGAGQIANNMPGYQSPLAIRSWGRHRVWDGPQYLVQRDTYDGCVVPGSVWQLGARLRLVDPVTNEGMNCNVDPGYDSPKDFKRGDDFCPKFTIYIRDSRGTLKTFHEGGYPEGWKPDEYNLFQKRFTFPEPDGGWTGDVRNFRIVVSQMNPGADMLMDDVYFTRVA